MLLGALVQGHSLRTGFNSGLGNTQLMAAVAGTQWASLQTGAPGACCGPSEPVPSAGARQRRAAAALSVHSTACPALLQSVRPKSTAAAPGPASRCQAPCRTHGLAHRPGRAAAWQQAGSRLFAQTAGWVPGASSQHSRTHQAECGPSAGSLGRSAEASGTASAELSGCWHSAEQGPSQS